MKDKRHSNRWSNEARQNSIYARKARKHLRMCRLHAVIIENPHVFETDRRQMVNEICRLARENGINVCDRSIYDYLKKLGINKKTKKIGERQYNNIQKYKP